MQASRLRFQGAVLNADTDACAPSDGLLQLVIKHRLAGLQLDLCLGCFTLAS